MSYDLIGHGVTLVLVIYFGLHLRSQLRTLKNAVEVQKATINAQAEQIKAQSTGLQDVERLNKLMQEVMALRERAYREMVERDAATLPLRRERLDEWYTAVKQENFQLRKFAASAAYATLRNHLPEKLREEIDWLRTPHNFSLESSTDEPPIQTRLLDEIARVEGEWGFT